jgi:hypothetical protein
MQDVFESYSLAVRFFYSCRMSLSHTSSNITELQFCSELEFDYCKAQPQSNPVSPSYLAEHTVTVSRSNSYLSFFDSVDTNDS